MKKKLFHKTDHSILVEHKSKDIFILERNEREARFVCGWENYVFSCHVNTKTNTLCSYGFVPSCYWRTQLHSIFCFILLINSLSSRFLLKRWNITRNHCVQLLLYIVIFHTQNYELCICWFDVLTVFRIITFSVLFSHVLLGLEIKIMFMYFHWQQLIKPGFL